MLKILSLAFLSFLFFNSCKESNTVCDCFETRLKVKQFVTKKMAEKRKQADFDVNKIFEYSEEFYNDEEYLELRKQKVNCRDKIEPEYFKENNIDRKGRSDKEFLLEEFSDCEALKELYNVK